MNIVRRKLHFIATTMRQQGDGTTKAEREWRLQVHTNILFYATKGNLKEFNHWMAQVSDIDFQDETGATAMHYACISGTERIVEKFYTGQRRTYLFALCSLTWPQKRH